MYRRFPYHGGFMSAPTDGTDRLRTIRYHPMARWNRLVDGPTPAFGRQAVTS